MSLLVPSPVYDSQDPNFLVEVLQSLPSPSSGELHDRTVSQRIIEATDYLHGVEHALRVNEHESAIKLFLKAFRISYKLLPAHPECAKMQSTDQAVMLLRKLRHRIEETHTVVMKIATPEKLIQEAGSICPSSTNNPPIDKSLSPPSPTRSSSTFSEASMGNHNVPLFPPRTNYTSTPPISAAVMNANVQALFDEASALFGQLRPLSQSESPRLPNNHMEDTSFLDPGWTIHQRKISEPDVFAALYEDLSRTDSGQNNSDMFVNMETGGGRDVPLFTDERSTDLYDFVPYHGITSAMYQHQPMTTSTLDGYISSDSSISYEFLNADEPLAHSNLPHRGEYSSSPPTFFAEDSEKSPSSTKKSRFSLGKKRPSTGSLTEEFSAVKIDPLASDNFKSRKRAETVASTSSVKIVFESTSSNDVKAIVKTTQHKSFWPKNYRVGSNAKKVNSTHLDSTEKNSKKQSSASYPPSSNGLPTYIPLISFMHQPQRAHRHASLKKKTEQTPTLKAGGNPGLQSNQMVPGELTGDHLDPNESREQDRFRTSPEIDYQHTMGNNTTPQVYIRPPHNQGDNHASLINGSTPWTSPNTSIPNPIIARLRLHARSNLGCIKYMSFSALISYSNDCFSNMRMYSENKDYANAYTHGIQGMIIVTNVLPHHHECRPETGAAYFNYIAAVEMIRYRYKEMLKSLQNKIEQEYRTM